jgi:hypothetical protein
MPYFIFSDGKQIFEYLAEPAFKILLFGNDNKNNSWQLSDLKIKIVSYTFKEIPASLFGNETNFYILLRPDNHISYIGNDLNIYKEFMNKIIFN